MGMQVHLVNSKEHLKEILVKHEVFPSFILQEYAKSAEFAMLCVRVIGEDVYPRFMLGSYLEEVNFKSVIAQGRLQLPCVLTDEIRDVALGATSLLGIDTARIDMFITDDGIKLCEVNTPGTILPTDQSYNMNVADQVVELAIRKLGQQ
jgi:glutathione synthase/RimK-type ligase-like ATP-grasp enzyme